MAHNATLSDINSGTKGPGTGSCRAEKNLCGPCGRPPWGRLQATERTMCVVCGHGSKVEAQARTQEHRSRNRSFMPTPPRSRWQRHLQIFLTPRRQSEVHGLRRDGCMGALGRPARNLTLRCQTNYFPSGVGQFCKRSLRSAAKAGPSPRLLLMPCPCEA
jgi:hypothetical protein